MAKLNPATGKVEASLAEVKQFFEKDGGPKVTMDELKSLDASDREYFKVAVGEVIGNTEPAN